MIDFMEYIYVKDHIAKTKNPATGMRKIIRLGLKGDLDFFITLRDVFVLWFAVFDDKRDCCGYHKTRDGEQFKITRSSLEKLIEVSRRKANDSVPMELEVPDKIKENYHLVPDSFTFELRKILNHQALTANTVNTQNRQHNLDVFSKLKRQWESNDVFAEFDDEGWEKNILDNDYWEKLSDDEVKKILSYSCITELLVLICQAKDHFRISSATHLSSFNKNSTDSKAKKAQQIIKKKPGRPPSPIEEAVRWAYNTLSENGDSYITKKGKLREFLIYLKECITEGNPNYSDYVNQRILEITNIDGDCKIIMQEFTPKEQLVFDKKRYIPPKRKPRISTILSELRKGK